MKHRFHQKLVVWFALALAVMFGVSAVAYRAFIDTAETEAAVQHTHVVIRNLNDILVGALDLETGAYGYAVAGTLGLLEPYVLAKGELDALLENLAHLVRDNAAQRDRTAALSSHIRSLATYLREVIAARERAGADAVRRIVNDEPLRAGMAQVRALIGTMIEAEEKLLTGRVAASTQARQTALAAGAGGVLVSMLIVATIFGMIRREGARMLAAEAGLAASNERLSASLERADGLLRERDLLDHLVALLHSCKTVAEAKDVVSKQVPQALPDYPGVIYVFRSSRNLVEQMSTWNEPRALAADASFAPESCWALRRGVQHVMRGPQDVACAHVDTAITRAAVCTPMIAHGEIVGVMYVEPTPAVPLDPVLPLLRRFSDEIGMSLAALRLQETLRHQSLHDPLTGLFNRRYAEDAIPREVSRAIRQGQPLGFLMIDIDHFKAVNDRYGHGGGDSILVEVAGALRRGTRAEDIACRFGGEEFLIVLGNASVDAARERAEALRKSVETLVVTVNDGVPVRDTTISVGAAAYPAHGASWEEVVARADGALYRAKAQGRNRVVTAE